MTLSPQCVHRERLLKASVTRWGRWRWAWHVRRCAECADMVRVEEEMTRLFELVGGWEESTGFVERIQKTLPTYAFSRPRLVRRLWEGAFHARAVRVGLVFVVVGIVLWWHSSHGGGSTPAGAVFASMMESLTARSIFHTRGRVTTYDPTTGAPQTQTFDKWLRQVSDSYPLRWQQRLEIGRDENERKTFFAQPIWYETSINFPGAVYRVPQGTGKQATYSQLRDFSVSNLITDRLVLGVPFLTRSAAEALASHSQTDMVVEPQPGGTQPSSLKVTLRDAEGSVLTCIFDLNPSELLPYRVRVSYAKRGRVRVTSTYTIQYPNSVPKNWFPALRNKPHGK